MLERLIKIINETMPEIKTEGVTEDTRLVEDLQFDSLSIMMLSMSLEDEFGITFDEPMMFKTVGEVIKYVDAKRTK